MVRETVASAASLTTCVVNIVLDYACSQEAGKDFFLLKRTENHKTRKAALKAECERARIDQIRRF
jgi:hypothetical protein